MNTHVCAEGDGIFVMAKNAPAQADLFWRWRVSPGALIPVVQRDACWTITNSNGGGYHILWYYDRIAARGPLPFVKGILNDKLRLADDPEQTEAGAPQSAS